MFSIPTDYQQEKLIGFYHHHVLFLFHGEVVVLILIMCLMFYKGRSVIMPTSGTLIRWDPTNLTDPATFDCIRDISGI